MVCSFQVNSSHAVPMHQFTLEEFELLLDDLLLYCGDGNIREITDTYGPTPHGGACGGLIRANMDDFKFTTAAFHDQKDYWAIDLPSPKACLTLGHRRIETLCFPKIHLDQALSERYRIANILNYCYNYFSGVTNSQRRRDLEEQLGYSELPTPGAVIGQIERDIRSFEPPYQLKFEASVRSN